MWKRRTIHWKRNVKRIVSSCYRTWYKSRNQCRNHTQWIQKEETLKYYKQTKTIAKGKYRRFKINCLSALAAHLLFIISWFMCIPYQFGVIYTQKRASSSSICFFLFSNFRKDLQKFIFRNTNFIENVFPHGSIESIDMNKGVQKNNLFRKFKNEWHCPLINLFI